MYHAFLGNNRWGLVLPDERREAGETGQGSAKWRVRGMRRVARSLGQRVACEEPDRLTVRRSIFLLEALWQLSLSFSIA